MQEIDQAKIKKLEEEYDPEMQMRPMTAPATWIVGVLLATLSCFHYYTAGFGLLRESTHRGVHLAFVLGLIFLVFGITRKRKSLVSGAFGGIPFYDWLLALIAAVTCFYVPFVFDDLAFRVGDPLTIDVVFGSLMIILTLEATRRSMGIALPLIALGFMLYGLFGQYAPGVLVHPGASWKGLVNHLYLTSQGIYGIAVGVVATYVFHFVLFGVLANRIGAGQLFIDLASCVAGRYAGGPAKVSVFSSALFGMISGSSIANTVTTGALTIPAMKRVGYRPHFAAAVEATSSTGGQITPPIMGAAAFIMIEFLEMPYRTILLAATVPALMHYLGIFTMVHLEAKRLGLRGLRSDEMPSFYKVMREGWPTLIPLILLIAIITSGRTPYNAAFWGITSCIVVGFFQPRNRLTLPDLYHCFKTGAQYALAVGASAASVGIIVGVVSLTGMGFKISFMVTSASQQLAEIIVPLIPFGLTDLQGLTLFLTLIFTAFACIILGAGIPTTATYIVLVSIAAPALGLLGVAPIVAHFFVFYYGVLADITPPVALAAYAGAGIAGANPFKAGNTAFRLASAKALVPFVFLYSPSMLIVTEGFTWQAFALTVSGCALGIVFIGAALTGYFFTHMVMIERVLTFIAALLIVAPGVKSGAIGLFMIIPVIIIQFARWRVQKKRPRAAQEQAQEQHSIE
ncbi:MAG: TRAP transporter permease [Desulfobacterales bacterium]|nr:TRAP transporter permease [Deltaproteobacteria bacterium]NNK93824.1 TRAP transporter permease [Desulfobacterales bacterium]